MAESDDAVVDASAYANPPVRGIRPRRVAELVSDYLRREIIEGTITRELPREAVLMERFNVSRPSLREAYRILETEGLIRIRRGKVGGAEVMRPTSESAAYHLGLVLQSDGAKLTDLAAARLVIEPACAGMAADRENHEEIAAVLDKVIDMSTAYVDPPSSDFTAAAQRFHDAITVHCGNHTMRLLASALENVWNRHELAWAEDATAAGSYPELELREEVVMAHRAITRRIRRGDVEGAQVLMASHLKASQPYTNPQGGRVDVIGQSARPGGPY